MLSNKVPDVLCGVCCLPRFRNIEYLKEVMKDTLFNVLVLEPSLFIIRQKRQTVLNKQLGTPSDHLDHTYLSNVIEIGLSNIIRSKYLQMCIYVQAASD